jgi:hypothetical protein
MVAYGPAHTTVKSRTRKPLRGKAVMDIAILTGDDPNRIDPNAYRFLTISGLPGVLVA